MLKLFLIQLNNNGVFDKVHKISESSSLKEILFERGISDILKNNFINQDYEKETNSVLESKLKSIDENASQDDKTKLLGCVAFGEMTINEVLNKGLKIITPLKKEIENIGLDPDTFVNIAAFMFMYKSICTVHAKVLSKYDPYKKHYDKLTIRQQQKLQVS